MCSRLNGVMSCGMLPFTVTQYFRKVLFVPEVKLYEQVLVAARLWDAASADVVCAAIAATSDRGSTLDVFRSLAKLEENSATTVIANRGFFMDRLPSSFEGAT